MAQENPRELMEGALKELQQVAQPVMQQAQGAPLTDAEQLREYERVRGNPHRVAAKVMSMMQTYQQTYGRPLGMDPLTAARQWEAAMETLRAKQRGTHG